MNPYICPCPKSPSFVGKYTGTMVRKKGMWYPTISSGKTHETHIRQPVIRDSHRETHHQIGWRKPHQKKPQLWPELYQL
jgi:hypothetical protein